MKRNGMVLFEKMSFIHEAGKLEQNIKALGKGVKR